MCEANIKEGRGVCLLLTTRPDREQSTYPERARKRVKRFSARRWNGVFCLVVKQKPTGYARSELFMPAGLDLKEWEENRPEKARQARKTAFCTGAMLSPLSPSPQQRGCEKTPFSRNLWINPVFLIKIRMIYFIIKKVLLFYMNNLIHASITLPTE